MARGANRPGAGEPSASRLEARKAAKLNERKPMPATIPTNQRKATTNPTGRLRDRVSHTYVDPARGMTRENRMNRMTFGSSRRPAATMASGTR